MKSMVYRYTAILKPGRARAAVSALALTAASLAPAAAWAQAQQADASKPVDQVLITANANAVAPAYAPTDPDLGPLGRRSLLDTPLSVTTVPAELITNLMARTVNDTLRYLPSVEIRDQQGMEVSRPQSRGFQGGIVQDTRLDGLNVIGTTAIAAENLAGIQVLNGLAGALYGPQPPAGVFDYQLKRPTDTPMARLTTSFESDGIFTQAGDFSGQVGPVGYRLNLVHGAGEGYVAGSHNERNLVSGDFDIHVDEATVLEVDLSHYRTDATGLPGSIVYFSGKSTVLPSAPNPTQTGLGQPGAGTDLMTNTALAKLKHDFGDGWTFEVGGLYQNAHRNLFGITDTMTNDAGAYTVTKNFTAVPHFNITSNTASLNGHVDVAGFENDVTIATNGFDNGQYSYRNSIAVNLGTGNLANPTILPTKATPDNGGQYKSGEVREQSVIFGDTLHLTQQFAVQATVSTSFLNSQSWSKTGAVTSSDDENGVASPTVSLIYKPREDLTLYATYANSIEQGDTAPAGTANANVILSPYRDQSYEAGVKYAITPKLMVTAAGFRMTRPSAQTDATTNVFGVVGTQRNWGGELFVQGEVTPDLSLFGGLTYIDARLLNSGVAATDDKRIVGVPEFKGDMTADYHPQYLNRFGLGGLGFTGTVHYESDRAATNTNNSYAPSYATVDLGVRYASALWGKTGIARLQVINVGDVHYYSSIADGNIVGSAGANTAYLGAPRTLLASLEIDL
ncbi:MAG: TonB-dependent receptor [Azospirillaceae bacterium]|nr:TonB-dependent receptor [Azospirillaceae bacterium]